MHLIWVLFEEWIHSIKEAIITYGKTPNVYLTYKKKYFLEYCYLDIWLSFPLNYKFHEYNG